MIDVCDCGGTRRMFAVVNDKYMAVCEACNLIVELSDDLKTVIG